MMPTSLDIGFALFFAVGIAGAAGLYFDKQLKRRIAARVPNARLNAYRRAAAVQWLLAATAFAIWSHAARPWSELGVVPPNGWRLYAGLTIAAILAVIVIRQNRAVKRLGPEHLEKMSKQVADVEMILPHDEREYRWFMFLSCTAGLCEELLYRGFLTWVLSAYVGFVPALVLASATFGLAHAYQGRRGILKTGIVGLLMSVIVLVSGWLIPAMVIHALIDVAGGVLGYAVIRRTR